MRSISQHRYVLLPVPKNPYSRIGPTTWQDYYRQLARTAHVAHQLYSNGDEVVIAVFSAFHPDGQRSERSVYAEVLATLAPDIRVTVYKEANDTVGQIKRGLSFADTIGATPIFIATWMHYPRVRYLARGRRARYCGAFGIPHPAFFFIDLFCLIAQPIGDFLGISNRFRQVIIREREQGRIL
jgi:hypothetical protein